jgi:hypothetical protein
MDFYWPSANRVKARRSASKATHIVVSSEIYSYGEGALTVKKKEDCRALDMKSNVRLQACDDRPRYF